MTSDLHQNMKMTKAWATKFQHVLAGEVTYGVYVGRDKKTVKSLLRDSRLSSSLVKVEIREIKP